MKLVGVRQAQAGFSNLLDRAQRERILLTRHGRPVAIITGVEEMELEEIVLSQDLEFWKLIKARRKSRKPLVSHEELVARTKRELGRRKGRGAGGEDVLLGQDRGLAKHIAARRRSRKPLLTLNDVKARLARSASRQRRSRSRRSR